MKMTVRYLYDKQFGRGWNPFWVAKYGIYYVGSIDLIHNEEDEDDGWLLFQPYPNNKHPIDNQMPIKDDTDLDVYHLLDATFVPAMNSLMEFLRRAASVDPETNTPEEAGFFLGIMKDAGFYPKDELSESEDDHEDDS